VCVFVRVRVFVCVCVCIPAPLSVHSPKLYSVLIYTYIYIHTHGVLVFMQAVRINIYIYIKWVFPQSLTIQRCSGEYREMRVRCLSLRLKGVSRYWRLRPKHFLLKLSIHTFHTAPTLTFASSRLGTLHLQI
jgi:hypothetical protein